jgi:hydrogenase/urease accessory protein HupE
VRLRLPGLLIAAIVLAPSSARAHLVTTGLGPVYDGITHLVVSPGDLLMVVALSLLAGLGGAAHGRWALATLPAAWLIGGLLGLLGTNEISLPILVAAALFAAGALVAADLDLSRVVMTGLVAVLGLVYGALNGTALAEAGAGALGLLGIVATVAAVVTLLAGTVVGLRAAWARIVVRVAGSWIAAIAILMLGWAIRG